MAYDFLDFILANPNVLIPTHLPVILKDWVISPYRLNGTAIMAHNLR